MPDTGAPWNIPYVAGTDLVSDWPTDSQTLAEAVADGLDAAGIGIGTNVEHVYKITDFTTTSTSYVDITGLTVTFTPSTATSKVLLIVTGALEQSAGGTTITAVQMLRDATIIGNTANARFNVQVAGAGIFFTNMATVFLDAPATTSAVTYQVQMRVNGGTGATNDVTTLTAIEVTV